MGKIFFIFLLIFNISNAKVYQSIDVKDGTFVQKGEAKLYCSNCAMLLPKYYKTNHIHNHHQYCSLHCLVESGVDVNLVDDIKVVDTNSLKFIDAQDAFYVVGSKQKGTMSITSKYAFSSQEEAIKFQKRYRGKIVHFQEAFEFATNDLSHDKVMIKTKREKVVYEKGKKLYDTTCKEIDLSTFEKITDLKVEVQKQCKLTKDGQIQMVSVYLWDVEKHNKKMLVKEKIKVPHDATCPVCAMFVHKYPKWAVVIEGKKNLYFDGVKDMVKYIFTHKKQINEDNIYVTDYFTSTKVKAKDAFYVIGSNVYGPMGNELVPFRSKISALAFRKDHFGKSVIAFYEIDQDVLDEVEEF